MQELAANHYRAIFESAPGLHLILTSELTVVAASDAYLSAIRMHRDDILGRHLSAIFPVQAEGAQQARLSHLKASLQKALDTKQPVTTTVEEYDAPHSPNAGDGCRARYWQYKDSPLLTPDGDVEFIVHSMEDVTELVWLRQRCAEQERVTCESGKQRQPIQAEMLVGNQKSRGSEDHFRDLVEGSKNHAICLLDPSGTITSWSAGAERIKGFQADEIIGQHISRLYPHEQVENDRPRIALEMAAAQERFEEEALRIRKDGSEFWADIVITALRDQEGRLRGYSKITRDITEKKTAEELAKRTAQARATAIWEQREQFRVTLRSIGDGVIVTDERGYVRSLNTVAEVLTGWKDAEALGRPLADVFDVVSEETRQPINNPVQRALQERVIVELSNHTLLISRDGTERAITDTAAPIRDEVGEVIGVVLVFRDVSEAKDLEEQNRQSQRMEAIGNLAGGIAHDFNNLLTVINGYSQYLVDDLSLNADNRKLATEILKAGKRAASLTRQLLAFSRKQVLRPVVLDLNDVVADTATMLERLIGEDITFSTMLSPDLWKVKIDRGQIEQVLLNFAVNSRDAMPDGGKLTLQTTNFELDSNCTRWLPEAPPGPYVLLSVTDTGCGMTPAVKARVFEPFFTTKPPGQGTGLGLSTVFGIVKQSGGQVTVSSEVGVGTCFKIYLPKAVDVEEPQVERKPKPTLARGTETILVVEDEEVVRALAVRILEHQGYSVVQATNGKQALLARETHPSNIDLVLTDVVMPELNGSQLAEALRRDHPTLKVLFMSGYTDDAVIRRGILHADVDYIQKPFTPAVLAEKVRQALDR